MAANKNYVPRPEVKVERPGNFYNGSSGTSQGIGPLSSVREASRSVANGPQPIFRWDYRAPTELEQQPVLAAVDMLWAGANGSVLVMPKSNETPGHPYRFPADAPISVQPGQYGELAYVGSHDGSLYALHIPSGKALWRFAGGSPIHQKPAVTDDDVYVAPRLSGLYRLSRATGHTHWRNTEARRFLAANPKFVYAADRNGRLMVLDRARGTTLSTYPGTIDFVVPFSNEQTDRIFLAAHDGLLVCLHDRDYPTPVKMKEDEEKLLPQPEKLEPRLPGTRPAPPPLPGKPNGQMPGKPEGGMMGKPGEGMMGKPGEGMPQP
jgi:hypothetical protein